MTEDAREEWLRDQQDGRVYSIGRALRTTFDADNHDSLGSDVTGLMIDLSKVPDVDDVVATPPLPSLPAASAMKRSVLARLTDLIGRR